MKWIKRSGIPLAIFLIFIAILFSVFRAMTPWAKQYKGQVEQHLSSLLGQPVVINSMETTWYWFEPVLKLNQVTVSDHEDHVLTLDKLLVGINLLSSLWHWHIQPGVLYVDDVHLTLHQVDNHWQIDGLRADQQTTTLNADAYLPVLTWLFGQQKIIIKNVSAMIHLNDGSLIPLSELNLTAVNHSGRYRLKGSAKLAQTVATELSILADMNVSPYAMNQVSGHVYLSIRRLLPAQWQGFFPQMAYHLDGGKGHVELWLDFLKGRFSGMQSVMHFNRIAWSQYGKSGSQLIQSLRANLAWEPTNKGWRLSGDKIQLRMGDILWPENAFSVTYQASQQAYRVFVDTLLLEPLLAADIEWPDVMKPVLAVHPRGQLHGTQLGFQQGQINYVLSSFDELAWRQRGKLPAVNHLSGVLSWQPNEGRLELDGQNTRIALAGQRPLTLTQANASLEWKTLTQGMLRLSLDRLVLSHPDFVLSARGALDDPFSPSTRQARFTAEFSANHATQWLAYIPSKGIKPKLDDWLKHDIKRIDKVSGRLVLRGAWADFPFDKQPGDFSIAARLSGVDLFFNKQWPLSRDVDAYLRMDKRVLDVDILHADLSGVPVSAVNLRMEDVGLDQETLLVHGNVTAPASRVKSYIQASPLKTHLTKLNQLDIQGSLGLDLKLEVPLYPENDEVLVRGEVQFNRDRITFHHLLHDLQFNDLKGLLQFDEHGVVDSDLNATLFSHPIHLRMLSTRQPKPATEVHIEGETTTDVLQKELNLPLLSLMHGPLKIESLLTLTDDPKDLDRFQMSTSLQGVALELPAPFGKSRDDMAPFTMTMDFNPQQAFRLRANYDNRISSDLWFMNKNGAFALQKGEIRVGGGQARSRISTGLAVVGSLATCDVPQWKHVLKQYATGSPVWLDKLRVIDLKVNDVFVWNTHYMDVGLRANQLTPGEWSLNVNQPQMAGDLHYVHQTNTLSGQLAYLHVAKTVWSQEHTQASSSQLKPMDIPNLDLTVEKLMWGDINVGQLMLKSHSTPTRWHADDIEVDSPSYHLKASGDWNQLGKKNDTVLEATLKTTNLGTSLAVWNISPVVDAHKGVIQFKGGWPGAIDEFALARVKGDLYMNFENGRITHLSPETEEKLGLGKLLSVLSLQTIPRRLKLDFSDLSSDGYSFDVFKGNFTLANGVMNTTNSYIDGPVAYASMKGDLDVIKQLYDMDLHISPHITASLPVVATIAGGPIAGMAAWVASKIINQGMQQVTGYTYKISGPWLDPVVQQVSILKKQ